MSMLRFDHVGVVVDDLDAAAAFFRDLGFEVEGRMRVEGETVDKINGLEGVQAELAMVRTPDGTGKLELVKYHAPADDEGPQPAPANRLGYRHLAIEVNDLNVVEAIRPRRHSATRSMAMAKMTSVPKKPSWYSSPTT
jgi:catechol 2,3-dioxygenase-like lactoylglutathione lyase family enzyme